MTLTCITTRGPKGNDTKEHVLTWTPIGHTERRMPDDCKRLDKLMRAQYRFAAGSICLLLLQSIGSFCANTGFPQLAPAVVAAAQDLPSRAPASAVPNEVLIVFRHDAPQNVEDFARDYRLVHVASQIGMGRQLPARLSRTVIFSALPQLRGFSQSGRLAMLVGQRSQ